MASQCNVRRLLFADDLALLSSNKNNLLYALDQFSDACLDAEVKITTAKTEIMYLSKHHVQCSFQTNGATLKQMEKFKYLGVILSSNGKQDRKLDRLIGKASAVMRQLYRLIVLKRDLCTKAKLSVFRLVFLPIITYGHECWVMTERVRSRIQAAEIGFLREIRGLSLLDKVKSTDIRQSLIKSLLLHIEQF